MIKNIPKPQKSESVATCLSCDRKYLFITKSVVFDHFFRYKKWRKKILMKFITN